MSQTRPRRLLFSSRCVRATAALLFVAVILQSSGVARAAPVPRCGGMSVVAESAGSVVFRLPEQAGDTLVVNPDDELLVRAENIPTSGRVEISVRMPFGTSITEGHEWVDMPLGGSHEVEISSSEFARYARGKYETEVALFNEEQFVCRISFSVRFAGFGGIAPAAAAGAAAASGTAAVVTAAWSASGSGLKLRLRLAVRRRRGRGLRRWIPAPAWRRTITSTVMGVVTGLLTTVALQQAGIITLTTGSVVSGSVIGGGVSFGVGLVWGSLLEFLRTPQEQGPTPTVNT